MTVRPMPRKDNLRKLKGTILGFCGALAAPTIYMSANTGDKYPSATALHEKCHAILINSTQYGTVEQILTRLLKTACTHIPRSVLSEAIDLCIMHSFHTHEGCATLSEMHHIRQWYPLAWGDFVSGLDSDYRDAASRLSKAADAFGFEGYLHSWMGLQIAAVCLSPSLFGPLCLYENYKNGRIVNLFSEDGLSADARLERIIADAEAGRLRELVRNIRMTVDANVVQIFGDNSAPDWQMDHLRHDFVRRCEPAIEDSFTAAYPGFYSQYRMFHEGWRNVWRGVVADFESHGCHCLSDFAFEVVDLLRGSKATRPVASPVREGHAGAVELESLRELPMERGTSYYIAFGFCEQEEPVLICKNPPRLLEKGHLYARFHPYDKRSSEPVFPAEYWFKFFDPSQASSALEYIAQLPGVRVCTISGSWDRVLARAADCWARSLDGFYVQLDGLTVEGFEAFLKTTSSCQREIFFLYDPEGHNLMLFLKSRGPGYHAAMPMTEETLTEIMRRVQGMGQAGISPGRPSREDQVCYVHLCRYGW